MQGQIEKIKKSEANGKPTWLLIGGQWYGTFEKLPCQEGDLVEFTFETKTSKSNGKEYKNIKSLTILDHQDQNTQARRMLRSVALKAAARVSQDPTEVIEDADLFYEWLAA